ncbi:MAG: FAD-binding protein, partial [Nitrososphaerales archaeon]
MTDAITDVKLSRRQFVGTAAAGAAALGAVAGATTLIPKVGAVPTNEGGPGRGKAATAVRGGPIPVPQNWSQTADVVVVGYGGAGAISAISAYDAGANVLILEKVPSFATLGFTGATYAGGGGNTSMDAGNAIYACDPIAAATYYYQVCGGNTPMALCEALAWMETDNPAWCTKMGVKYSGGLGKPGAGTQLPEFTNLPGASGFGAMTMTGGGNSFFATLAGQVQSRNIPVLFNTPATDLIQDPNTKEILGVQALANSSEVLNIRANRGVILTTGSIEFNEELKSDNFRPYPAHYYGWPYCTGDSVKMASKVGAAMWHMGVRDDHIIAWFPDYPNAYSVSVGTKIYVDKLGNRFTNESLTSTVNFHMHLMDYDINVPWYTRVPAFIISDATGFATNFASGGGSTTLPTYYDPRAKFSNTMALANGWIQQGADIPSLVKAMNAKTYIGIDPKINSTSPFATANVNIDPNVLTATINAWNAMVAA